MKVLLVIGGVLMLVGGLGQLYALAKRRGHGRRRGPAVTAAAITIYGVLVLAGLVPSGSALGAILVWAVALATSVGLWLTRRDTAITG